MIEFFPRLKILRGVRKAAKAVQATYGPLGRNALIERVSGILATKDGATVIREIELSDPVENMGVRFLIDAALKTESGAGDGTSTTVLLAAALLEECHKFVIAGVSPTIVSRELLRASDALSAAISDIAIPVTHRHEIEAIARVASKDDVEVSRHVTDALMNVGEYGTIVVQDGQHVDIQVEYKEGLLMDASWPTGFREYHSQKQSVELEGALVACFKQPLYRSAQVASCLEEATQWPHSPLVIIAPHIAGEALKTILMNLKDRGTENHPLALQSILPLKMPEPPHKFRLGRIWDIAALTGATVVDVEAGHNPTKFEPTWLGTARRINSSFSEAVFEAYEEHEVSRERHIEILQGHRDKSEFPWDRDQLNQRIAALDEGLCVFKVACSTDIETKERKARIEDTLSATQSALKYGMVPGAAQSLVELRKAVPSSPIQSAIQQALLNPLRVLATNSGVEPSLVSTKATEQEPWTGWDAHSNSFRDLRKAPMIVDTLSAIRGSIENAFSMASTVVLVEVALHG